MNELQDTKYFQLPKEFLTKWLEALRSGEYKQTEGYLYYPEEDGYCCIGVAMIACTKAELQDISQMEMPSDVGTLDQLGYFPEELAKCRNFTDPTLADILTSLNDDISMNNLILIHKKYSDLKWPKKAAAFFKEEDLNTSKKLKLSFEEIAEFLENNVKAV